MAAQITSYSFIDNGLPLSNNFLMEHVSSGAFHPVLGKWIPQFTSHIIPMATGNKFGMLTGGMPLWQLMRNLQIGSEGILEGLMGGLGKHMNIMSGFMNNIPKGALPNEQGHLFGNSFDIQVDGYQSNMFHAAKEIQRLATNAKSVNLVYGNQSWIHIEVDPYKVLSGGSSELPPINTTDIFAGVTESGITAIRGFIT